MKPFRDFQAKVRQGGLDEDLTKGLASLVAAVQATGRAGSLKMTITIKPTKGLAVEIEDDVTLKLPELSKPATLLFPTIEGNLQEQNPMQKSLDLTIVNDGGTKQLNTVNTGTEGPLVNVGGATP